MNDIGPSLSPIKNVMASLAAQVYVKGETELRSNKNNYLKTSLLCEKLLNHINICTGQTYMQMPGLNIVVSLK